jgi:hypothetical protein
MNSLIKGIKGMALLFKVYCLKFKVVLFDQQQ